MTERDDAQRATPGRRTISRRAVARGAALALPIAAGLRLASAQTPPPDAATAAADVATLNNLLALERLLAAIYDDGLSAFDAAAFLAASPDPTLRPAIEQARDAEVAHAAALAGIVTALGGAPPPAVHYVWSYGGLPGFLATARSLENSAVGAYAGAIPLVRDAAAIAALVGIHSVEARHAAYLADRSGAMPFPDPIDQPLTAADVAAIMSPFISGGATAVAAASAAPVATAIVVAPPPATMPTPAAETAAPMTPEATKKAKKANKKNNANAEETPTPTPAATNGTKNNANKKNKNAAKKNGGGKKNATPAAETTPAAEQAAVETTPAPEATTPVAETAAGPSTTAAFGGTPGLEAVLADAAAKFGVPADQIDIVTNEPREWPSSGLGCEQPGQVYAQVMTPGYVVLLQSGVHRIEYHLDTRGNFVACKSI
jgi:Ferritin-like domain